MGWATPKPPLFDIKYGDVNGWPQRRKSTCNTKKQGCDVAVSGVWTSTAHPKWRQFLSTRRGIDANIVPQLQARLTDRGVGGIRWIRGSTDIQG